ncbi:hypothetical protein ACIPQH_24870 [Streptomyces rubiginosohelvolus]|uniref:hypothetical protein n=1 Tax=Streptomyces rubiginosohelvolus TaxID=67362 RepID=UPI003806C379
MSRRPYCRCKAVRNYDYDEAAAKLGCQPQWLRDNVGKLPRQKFGHNPAVFCECELALIQQMHTVLPDNVAELLAVGAADPQGDDDHQVPAGEVGRPSLASLVPASAHSRKAS